ncbi:DUF4460 domain-containing protein [Deltaproteobacteria bacterium TL4]
MNKPLKKLIARIHPDKFQNFPSFQQINQDSLQKLLKFWELSHEPGSLARPHIMDLRFYYQTEEDLFEKLDYTLEIRGPLLYSPELRELYADYCVASMRYQCGDLSKEPQLPEELLNSHHFAVPHEVAVYPEVAGATVPALQHQLQQKLGCRITLNPRMSEERMEASMRRLMHYAGYFQHLDLASVELGFGSQYQVASPNKCLIPGDFNINECLHFIEAHFPRSTKSLLVQIRHLSEQLRGTRDFREIAGAQACSVTQVFLGLGRLNLYRKKLKPFNLSKIFLMIGQEFYVAGHMYYIPYDFDISELRAHFTLHLKEILRKQKDKEEPPLHLSTQLCFPFAANYEEWLQHEFPLV